MIELGVSSSWELNGPATGKDSADDGRGSLLILVLLLLAALAMTTAFTISFQPATERWEQLLYIGSGLGLAVVAFTVATGRLSRAKGAAIAIGVAAALMSERILRLFLSGYFDDTQRSLFMPVFAFLPLLYLLCFVLLRPPATHRIALGLWLGLSVTVTALTLPYWAERPLRSSLLALLSYLWFGQAIYLALFAATARHLGRLSGRLRSQARTERRLLAQVRASEVHFRSVFDLAAVGINVTDETGRYLMVNQRMVDLLGYSRDELLEMRFRDVTLTEDVETGLRLAAQLAAGGVDHFHAEKRYKRKDGQVVHAEIFVRELDRPTSGGRRFICVVLDITERKRAEFAASEHRLVRDFHFENTPLGVVEFDADLRIRRWSRRAEKLFGWTEAEVLGRTAEEVGVIPPEQVGARAERVRRMLHGGQDHLAAVVPMVHRSGRRLWTEIHNSVTRDEHGTAKTLVSMALDVTESQDMLHMLNESEARFRSIFHQAAVGIALLDERGRWLNVNQRLCEITGYSLDELMEVDFQSITHPDDLERDLHLSRAIMDRTLDHYSMEKRYVRKDGSTCWVMLFVRRIEATAETPARFVSVVEDISERKAAEERVRMLTAGLESQVVERTGQLREMIRAGQRRNEELSLVTEMSGLLAAASDPGEATQVVVRYLPRIFPQAEGALYLEGATAGTCERRLHWGPGGSGWAAFTHEECWALRRGEPHRSEGEADALCCPHLAADSLRHPHLCVPIVVLGSAAGVIELGWGRQADGWAPELALVKTIADKIGLTLGNLRLREELSRQALIDPLTGLHNRRWLEKTLRRRVADHARSGAGFAVLLIDADHFKSINDRFGHESGDLALQEIAGVLNCCTRVGEPPARLGGEEFVLLLSTDQVDHAVAAAERIRTALAALRVVGRAGALPPITASVGIAMFPLHGVDERSVLACADAALYEAKRRGRDQVCLHQTAAPVAVSLELRAAG